MALFDCLGYLLFIQNKKPFSNLQVVRLEPLNSGSTNFRVVSYIVNLGVCQIFPAGFASLGFFKKDSAVWLDGARAPLMSLILSFDKLIIEQRLLNTMQENNCLKLPQMSN
jgi:hypothetical protein